MRENDKSLGERLHHSIKSAPSAKTLENSEHMEARRKGIRNDYFAALSMADPQFMGQTYWELR